MAEYSTQIQKEFHQIASKFRISLGCAGVESYAAFGSEEVSIKSEQKRTPASSESLAAVRQDSGSLGTLLPAGDPEIAGLKVVVSLSPRFIFAPSPVRKTLLF